MTKENYNEHRLLDEATGRVKVTETYDLPRYRGRILSGCEYECEAVVSDIKEDCKIWTSQRSDYSILTNVELDPNEIFIGNSLSEDLEYYQKYLDRTFGKGEYEAFVLGAYIHSTTSFSVNKCGNHVCRFDSSQLGFIGLRKDKSKAHYSAENPDEVAEQLTAAWNGEYSEYEVIDNLTDDTVDCLVTADYKEYQDWCVKAKEKYNVDFSEINPIY